MQETSWEMEGAGGLVSRGSR